jgi:hypothetical protein
MRQGSCGYVHSERIAWETGARASSGVVGCTASSASVGALKQRPIARVFGGKLVAATPAAKQRSGSISVVGPSDGAASAAVLGESYKQLEHWLKELQTQQALCLSDTLQLMAAIEPYRSRVVA